MFLLHLVLEKKTTSTADLEGLSSLFFYQLYRSFICTFPTRKIRDQIYSPEPVNVCVCESVFVAGVGRRETAHWDSKKAEPE